MSTLKSSSIDHNNTRSKIGYNCTWQVCCITYFKDSFRSEITIELDYNVTELSE